jgi:hypothetical protein
VVSEVRDSGVYPLVAPRLNYFPLVLPATQAVTPAPELCEMADNFRYLTLDAVQYWRSCLCPRGSVTSE